MDPQGYDAGKKVTGRKRHILVDTLGLLLSVAVHPADIQDRDGAAFLLNASTRALFPFIERIFADGGYQGPRAAEAAAATGKWIIEIVKRNELHKFVVLPKRWIVIDCTMLPSRALIGHCSSNAGAAGGNRYSFR
jgi:transposase